MEDKKTNKQINPITSLHLAHLGKIFSNISLVCIILASTTFLTFLIYPLLYLLAFLLILCTLGIILIYYPQVGSFFTGGSPFLDNLLASIGPIFPYFIGVALVCSILSIIMLSLSKQEKNVGRIVFSYIIVGIAIIAFIAIIAGGI